MTDFPYRLGRTAATHPVGYRLIGDYVDALPEAPPTFDYTRGFDAFRMLGNGPDPSLSVHGGAPVGDCVTTGTLVAGEGVLGAYRAAYNGPIVRLRFASGRQLAVTPNHAVLTPRGFVPARLLKEGDDAVGTIGTQGIPSGSGFLDLDKTPAPVEQVFATLLRGGARTRRLAHQKIMVEAVDFHGDERFVDGDVEVIGPERFLRGKGDPSLSQPHSKSQVSAARESESALHRQGATLQPYRISQPAALGRVGWSCHGAAFRRTQLDVVQPRGLREGSDWIPSINEHLAEEVVGDMGFARQGDVGLASRVALEQRTQLRRPIAYCQGARLTERASFAASRKQPVADGAPTDPHLFTDLLKGPPGLVQRDRLLDIQWDMFCGHVYDLSTSRRWYLSNGIVTHNCAFVGTVNAGVVDAVETDEPVRFPTSNEVVSTYLAYDHGQDVGANLSQLLALWHKTGLPWSKPLVGYAAVNFRDPGEFWASVNAFGCGYVGILVTQAMQEQTARGEPWDLTGSYLDDQIMGGHCVVVISRTPGGGEVATWGMRQAFTDRWLTRFLEEAHVVITPQQAQAKGNGCGLDIEHLQADLARL